MRTKKKILNYSIAILAILSFHQRQSVALEGDSFRNRVWTNWSKNHSRNLEVLVEPATREELVSLILDARQKGKTLKVLGSGHSLSAIALPDSKSWAISLRKYSKIIKIDRETFTATVQAGITMKQLTQELSQHGLQLPMLGTTTEQTVSGGTQTGTHGTGKAYQALHAQILEMQVINGKGEFQTLSATQNPELFRAYQCGLGVLGIVDTITFRVVEAVPLHEVTYPEKWPEILDHVENLINQNDRFRFHWYPYTESVGVWIANPDKNLTPLSFDSEKTEKRLKLETPIQTLMSQFKAKTLDDMWENTPASPDIRSVNQALFDSTYPRLAERRDRIDSILGFEVGEGNVYAAEGAFPAKYTKAFFGELDQLIQANHYPAHGGVEVRFVKADNANVSPTYSENPDDLFCYVNINVMRPYGKQVPYVDYFNAFQKLLEKYNGRLHWGKMGNFDPNYLRTIYPKWDEFRKIQVQEDPDGIFLNEFTRSFLERKERVVERVVKDEL